MQHDSLCSLLVKQANDALIKAGQSLTPKEASTALKNEVESVSASLEAITGQSGADVVKTVDKILAVVSSFSSGLDPPIWLLGAGLQSLYRMAHALLSPPLLRKKLRMRPGRQFSKITRAIPGCSLLSKPWRLTVQN